MRDYMKKLLTGALSTYWKRFNDLGIRQKLAVAIALVAVAGGVVYTALNYYGGKTVGDELSGKPPSVELIPVSGDGEHTGNQPSALGSEVVIRAETSGKIVSVLPTGTRVSVGAIIARFENSAQQAALLQAEGSLEAAKASFEKTQGGLRSEKIAVLETAFENAQSAAVATLLSAYGIVDSAVRDTAGQVFSNPDSDTPQPIFSSSNSQRRIELVNERVMLKTVLLRESTTANTITANSNLSSELTATEKEVREVRIFIDTLISSLNEAIATNGVTDTDIATYKAAATGARTALTSVLSSIASARASLETTQKNLEEGLSGAEDTDRAVSTATVKQAQGAYDAALSAYQKTIVRAPAPGTVVSCNASSGDVISVGNDVCRIRSTSAVSGKTFILPLSSVKYTPLGAFVFVVSEEALLETIEVTTGLVTADGITVTGLSGDEFVVRDVRGRKAGEKVNF